MKFIDKHIFRDERFSVGIEETTEKYYISIPVANPYVEHEEYYEINISTFRACPGNIDELRDIVERCRARENDGKLIVKPGNLRGSPI